MIIFGVLHNQRFDLMKLYSTKKLAQQAIKKMKAALLTSASPTIRKHAPGLTITETKNTLFVQYKETSYSDNWNIIKLRVIEAKPKSPKVAKADVKA